MSAEYGHTPRVINSSLKSGSNAFHAGFYEFFRNNVLDAAIIRALDFERASSYVTPGPNQS